MFASTRKAVVSRLLPPAFNIPNDLLSITDIGADESVFSPAQYEAIWKALKRYYRTGMNPGVSLAIRHKGKLAFNRAIGYSQLDQQSTLKADDPVCLFSASKAITAMLIHHLVENGELKLSDPVTKFIPEYAKHGKGKTTVLDVLAHRAGVARLDESDPEILFDFDVAMQRLIEAKPMTAVGKRQAYHALTGGFILGEIVKRVTQKSLNQLLDELIRKPLGMTYFQYGISPKRQPKVPLHYSAGYTPALLDMFLTHAIGGGLDMAVELSNDPRFMSAVIPAGNMYATAEELTRFYQMLLDGGVWQGKRIFEEATIRKAVKPVSSPIVIDGSLLVPLRFSAGFMLGGKTLSPFGPNSTGTFGHLGFATIETFADPTRDLSVALMTTGKGIVGTQVPDTFSLLGAIKKQAERS